MPSVVLKGMSAIYSYSNCILCLWELFKIISIKPLCCESIKHQRGYCPDNTFCLLVLIQSSFETTNEVSYLAGKLKGCFNWDRIGILPPPPPPFLNKVFHWYIKIGHGIYGKKTTTSHLSALFVTAFLHKCVLLAGLMFMPSSSRNMQRGCQISCCQMIMEIFFSSGERSLRIWIFFLEVRPGADFRNRGCICHKSCVIF